VGLVIAGIDEAGYGPLLGPLCVGLSVLRVRDWSEGDKAPNLWKLLASGVTDKPNCPRGRIAVADSKKLKLSNDSVKRHPLTHLERGVLAFLDAAGREVHTDVDLATNLGFSLDTHTCYAGEPIALPVAAGASAMRGITSNLLTQAIDASAVDICDLRLIGMSEPQFNAVIKKTGSKGNTVATALGEHLAHILDHFGGGEDSVRIVCDRLGGRMQYGELIEWMLPGATVEVLEETELRSRYTVEHKGRRAGMVFQVECEKAHLPVALASMLAKYGRELAMMRFNRYWSALTPELKPTAGYWQDAQRWLKEIGSAMTPEDRKRLIRIG
jgi:hypothetical protein